MVRGPQRPRAPDQGPGTTVRPGSKRRSRACRAFSPTCATRSPAFACAVSKALFSGFPRIVRDLSPNSASRSSSRLENGEVELDREMIELIRDPLVHYPQRGRPRHRGTRRAQAAGKREIGMLRSPRARPATRSTSASWTTAGHRRRQLAAKAVAAGILTAERSPALSTASANALIYEPACRPPRSHLDLRPRRRHGRRPREHREVRRHALIEAPRRGHADDAQRPADAEIVPSLTVDVGGQTFAIPRSLRRGDRPRVE